MRNFASWLFRISFCTFVLALSAAQAAAANLDGTITYGARGTTRPGPLVSVLVSVYNPATRQKMVTRTNDLGRYLYKSLPGGVYVILVEKDGRRVYQGKVEVREPETRFDIQL
jgi:hypothetical protein